MFVWSSVLYVSFAVVSQVKLCTFTTSPFRCVIAELFLEGQQLFELSQLLAYRRGQYDPSQHLEKVFSLYLSLIVTCLDLNFNFHYLVIAYCISGMNKWLLWDFIASNSSFYYLYTGWLFIHNGLLTIYICFVWADPRSWNSKDDTPYDPVGTRGTAFCWKLFAKLCCCHLSNLLFSFSA